MKDEIRQRIQAVQRFLAGEKPESICASMGRSRSWLYKWLHHPFYLIFPKLYLISRRLI